MAKYSTFKMQKIERIDMRKLFLACRNLSLEINPSNPAKILITISETMPDIRKTVPPIRPRTTGTKKMAKEKMERKRRETWKVNLSK